MPRAIAIIASWVASSASSGWPTTRRHTAWIRSTLRSRSTSSACRSPREARAARTESLSSRNPHLAHVDVVLPVLARGQLGEPEQHRAPLDPADIEGVRSFEVGSMRPRLSPVAEGLQLRRRLVADVDRRAPTVLLGLDEELVHVDVGVERERESH